MLQRQQMTGTEPATPSPSPHHLSPLVSLSTITFLSSVFLLSSPTPILTLALTPSHPRPLSSSPSLSLTLILTLALTLILTLELTLILTLALTLIPTLATV